MHRLAALLMLLVTLNVSAAEALRACASQARHQKVEHQHCEKPVQDKAPAASCCDAMTSCGASVTIDGAADEARVIPDRAVVAPDEAFAPLTGLRTPEPPPPKS